MQVSRSEYCVWSTTSKGDADVAEVDTAPGQQQSSFDAPDVYDLCLLAVSSGGWLSLHGCNEDGHVQYCGRTYAAAAANEHRPHRQANHVAYTKVN